ncbi:transposase [Streptomyces sp. NPDC020742]|uniref:transposase n=1 Tax=unclassified Streptomyces TaxID=2593676 RepID=UPI0033F25359
MARRPVLPPQEKAKIVLSVLSKERTAAEAAQLSQVSEQSIANWRRQFIDSGTEGLAGSGKTSAPPSLQEQKLRHEVRNLKIALGEAYVELMTWRRVGNHHGIPSRTSS